MNQTSGEPPAAPDCRATTCLTCSDQALPARVHRLLPARMALVEVAGRHEEISVALVTAQAGDTVLVHAGEAIALLRPDTTGETPT